MSVEADTAQALVDAVFALGRSLRAVVAASGETPIAPALTSVLFVLAARGECRQNELATDLCVSQSSLSRQISELVDAGYVSRTADPDDKRASRIRVSPNGMDILRETTERRAERLRGMLEGWSQEQALAAVTSLTQLNDTFTTSVQQRGPRV
ncbi:MarR family winged helix-turn-helix transcriptional regulator [Rhodococcus jostii]|uniref:DNA-binding transcriptional regulator, MarR family n=1 Tax=Rhodococcus jostii TaxID=132919 RepID=A0A1H4SRF5_RHOJO|nr:MarR family transcriptional regulator [Rhodococcus jostii]SEC46564.1 DNA-binding transcriptional regulator, MarR family [Rhodococcus jostii]